MSWLDLQAPFCHHDDFVDGLLSVGGCAALNWDGVVKCHILEALDGDCGEGGQISIVLVGEMGVGLQPQCGSHANGDILEV